MHYLLNHWRGKLSLNFAVWVNFITVLLIGCLIEALIHYYFKKHHSSFTTIAVLYFVFFHVLIFIWQAVGVLRSCDNNLRHYIASGWTRSAQFLVLTVFAATLIWGVSLGQGLWKLKADNHLLASEKKYKPLYSFEIVDINSVAIQGIISPGITSQFKQYLSLNPDIKLVILNSTGGNIFEARGIAKLIQERKLNTYVSENCFSSCTTVFVAGENRGLGADAKLGFHQYTINSKKLFAPNVDVKKELDKDIASFLKQGVDQAFLDKAFSMPHTDMWFPNHDELFKAGISNE